MKGGMLMLEDMTPPQRIFTCAVRTLHDGLEPNDQSILAKAINDPKVWSNNGLEKALRARGLMISEKAIRKHRASECSCPVGWPHA